MSELSPKSEDREVEGTTCAKDAATSCFLYQGHRGSGGKQVAGTELGQVPKAPGRVTLSFGETGMCSISRVSVLKKTILEIDTEGSRER